MISAAAVLAAAVAVEDEAGQRAARSQGLLEASMTKSARRCPARGQPTILREQRMMTTARQSQLAEVGMKGMSPAQTRSGLAEEQVGRGFVGAAIAGFGYAGLGLDGAQAALAHDPADAIRRADHARGGEFRADSAIAIAAALALEDGLDPGADPAIHGLGGRGRGGVVIAAARHLEAGTDLPDATAYGLSDVADHLPELEGESGARDEGGLF